MDNIQEECSVRFILPFHAHCKEMHEMQRVNQNFQSYGREILLKLRPIFFTHDNFNLDARAVERIRCCVLIFILVAVYTLDTFELSCSTIFDNDIIIGSSKESQNKTIFRQLIHKSHHDQIWMSVGWSADAADRLLMAACHMIG